MRSRPKEKEGRACHVFRCTKALDGVEVDQRRKLGFGYPLLVAPREDRFRGNAVHPDVVGTRLGGDDPSQDALAAEYGGGAWGADDGQRRRRQ